MDMDILVSVLFSPSTPFLLWGLVLLPFLIRRKGLAPLHVAVVTGLSGLALIAAPSWYGAEPHDTQRWIFLVLCVLAPTVASYFGKRLYDRDHS